MAGKADARSAAESMQELAKQLWERYIKPRASKELLGHSLDGYKATVISNNGDQTLTVRRPFDDQSMTLKCTPALAQSALNGDQVLVVSLGDLSNSFVLCGTDMSGFGSGAGGERIRLFDFSDIDELQTFLVTTENDVTEEYSVERDEYNRIVTITHEDGFETEVEWPEDEPEKFPADEVGYDNSGSGLNATNVQSAIDEIAQGGGGGGGTAASVSYNNSTSGLSATNVQNAIDEVYGDIPTQASDIGAQPTITASGILKGNGSGGVSAAVAGTDYQVPLTAGTDYATPAMIPTVPDPSDATPQALGTATAGSSDDYSRADHVHAKPTYSKSDVGLGNVDNVRQYSASNPPPYPVTSVNGNTGAVTVSVPSAYTSNPAMDGTASPGSSGAWAKGDHVHPSDTSRIPTTEKGAANGVATLDSTGKVPSSQLPAIPTTAAGVSYDNTTSGLTADDVQEAIDELAAGAGGGGVDPETIAPVEESSTATTAHPLGTVFYFNDLLYRALADIPVGGTINTAAGGNATQTSIAQNFKRTVTLTSAEYAQLSAAEKAADIVYIITDDNAISANDVDYDNTASGLTATNVQEAIDEGIYWASQLIPSAATATPIMDGTAAVGSGSKYAREDHVHPTDTSRVPVYGLGKNLLDNAYFVGGGTGRGVFPVNQRGLTTYTGGSSGAVTIDGWRIREINNQVVVTADAVTIYKGSSANQVDFYQSIEPEFIKFALGKQFTISVLLATGIMYSSTFTWGTSYSSLNFISGLSVFAGGNSQAYTNFCIRVTAASMGFLAVKLEFGTEQTLAHQENGVWVLNEIPDYEEELLKCQTSTASSGDTFANKSLATEQQLAYVETGSTASRAYAVGECFCWNGLLYRATTAISSGADFTVGTNCEATTACTRPGARLIWTNPNQASSYSAQTIGIDLSAFTRIHLVFKQHSSDSGVSDHEMPIDGKLHVVSRITIPGTNSSSIGISRGFTPSSTGIVVAEGLNKALLNGTRSTDNNKIIPITIWGIY